MESSSKPASMSASTTHWYPWRERWISAIASCARRPAGPVGDGWKSASKMGSSTSFSAAWTTLSATSRCQAVAASRRPAWGSSVPAPARARTCPPSAAHAARPGIPGADALPEARRMARPPRRCAPRLPRPDPRRPARPGRTRLNRSSNRRPGSSPPSGEAWPGSPVPAHGLIGAHPGRRYSAARLPGIPASFPPDCCRPSPCAGLSRSAARSTTGAPPHPSRRPTAGLPAARWPAGRAAGDGSHVHRESLGQGGAQLCPCSIATATPQAFTVASRPTSTPPRSSRPRTGNGVRTAPGPYPPDLSR